ncbi:hypothetical protein F4777DRAFT_599229 [Nemania sp. FL0916]|nr:hypothetical protein F4777DRAFT_599229 [Nemania sp. FL0916]
MAERQDSAKSSAKSDVANDPNVQAEADDDAPNPGLKSQYQSFPKLPTPSPTPQGSPPGSPPPRPTLTIDTNIKREPHRYAFPLSDVEFRNASIQGTPDRFYSKANHSIQTTPDGFYSKTRDDGLHRDGATSEPTTPPLRAIVKGLTMFANVFKRKTSNSFSKGDRSPASKTYILITDRHGRIPLVTLQQRRYLQFSQPSLSEPLLRARAVLRDSRDVSTRNLPELKFPSGQAQIDIVAQYLGRLCATDFEHSPTTEFVRHSHTSLRIRQVLLHPQEYPRQARRNTQPERANVLEARRRVRHHNLVIEDFDAEWEKWVSEQSQEIQDAVNHVPEEILAVPHKCQGPLADFYQAGIIACNAEIEQRQDIAEALILQYPDSFPGFVRKREGERGVAD